MLIIAVVVENAARLSIPWLVRRGIDLGVPPLLAGGSGRLLYETVGLMVGAVVVQAISRMFFLRNSGTVGQKVLLELRRRLFKHFQKLDVRFHDRYTTGRVVSRLTNDIDAIMELLANGFDGLVTAVLTMVGRRGAAADARPQAGRGLPALLPGADAAGPLVLAVLLADLPQGARDLRAGDRAVHRDHDRHPGGPGLPPRAPQRRRSSRTWPAATARPTSTRSGWSRSSCPASS